MASVTADDVRDVINVSSAEVSDSKITKMIKRAELCAREIKKAGAGRRIIAPALIEYSQPLVEPNIIFLAFLK